MKYLPSIYNFINHNSIELEGKEMEFEDTCKPRMLSSNVQGESSEHMEMLRITWIIFLPWPPSSLPSSASHIAPACKTRLFHHKPRALPCLQASFARWAVLFCFVVFLGWDTVPTACNLPWWVTDTLAVNASVCWFYPEVWYVCCCASFQSLGSAHSPLLRATFIFICYLFSWLMKLHPSGCQYKMLKKKISKNA